MVRIANPIHSTGLYVGLFLAYFLAGHTLSLFSFQAQIVPIWLPAGIALVGCYIWWWRFLPAVFIASFAFNYSVQPSADMVTLLTEQGLGFGFIAFGASLQALVGSALLRYWLGHPLRQVSNLKILYFVLTVGLFVNLISSTIGTYSLSMFNPNYSEEHFWNNIFYWWLGDSLGILLATPFLLSLISVDNLDREQKRSRILVLSTASVLLFSVLVLTNFFISFSNENTKQSTAREIKSIENGLYRELNNSMAQLQNLASYIQNTKEIKQSNFTNFVNELIATQPTIAAMSWNPIISQQDKEQHQLELSNIYGREVIIRGDPLISDDPIVYVKLIVPEEKNSKAIGFNVFSNKDRKKTLIEADLSFQPRATPIIQLVQSETKSPAYLMFFPVFKGNKELKGFATGVFLVEAMLANALDGNANHKFDYELYEQDSKTAFLSNVADRSLINNESAESLEFDLAGQVWNLYLLANKEFMLQKQSQSYFFLYCLEFIIVASIILLILMMNSRQIQLNTIVSEKTNSLKKAVQEANEANKAKSRFLANMSHEIRTPMNAVVGFSALARKTDDMKTIQGYLEKIEVSSDLLLNIVNDILDISKIEAKKLILTHENFDLHESLCRISSIFKTQAENKQLTWQVNNNIPTSLYFKGDQVRFEQVLINLCSNALKFTETGGVSITADLEVLNNGQNKIIIRIKDSGIGISEDNQKKLFTAFTQADDSTLRRFGGTGLGLALSQELSHLMQGDIKVISQEGKGSEFIFECIILSADHDFELKQSALKHDQAQTARTGVDEEINKISKFAGRHMLIVEDNEINQLVIEAILDNLGITSDIVSDGKQAVEKVGSGLYDAVLMDCQMPIMDGYEATKRIRKLLKYNTIPILALTADVTEEGKNRAAESGFNSHLSKPIIEENLLSALEDCLPRE